MGTARRGLLRRAAAATLLALGLLVVTSGPASAHAGLASSAPVAGQVVATAPATVRLSFTEAVRPVVTAFVLYDSSGRTTIDGVLAALPVTGLDTVVTVTLPPSLPHGSYLMGWRVVSADSHPVSGVLSFAVGAPSAVPPKAVTGDSESIASSVTASFVALQILGYLGLFGAVGLRVFDLVRRSPADSVARRCVAAGLVTALVSFGLLVGLTVVREHGGSLVELTRAGPWRAGTTTPAMAVLALVAVSALLLAPRLRGPAARLAVLAGGFAGVASVLPSGHTRTVAPVWLMSALDLVHASTAAVWFGGVIGLGLHLRAVHRRSGDPVAAAGVVVRFSVLAGVLVGLLGASGVGMAVLVMSSPRALLTTDYGHTLLVKIAVTGVVALLAVGNKAFLVKAVSRRPGIGPRWRRLRSAVRDEALLLVAVLAVTGLLTQQSPTAPARPPEGTTVSAVSAQRSERSGSDLQRVAFGTGSLLGRLQPAWAGPNSFEFTVRDADGAALRSAAVPEVRAWLPSADLGPLSATVTPLDGVGHYRSDLRLPVGGDWRIVVSVRLSRFEEPTAAVVTPVSG